MNSTRIHQLHAIVSARPARFAGILLGLALGLPWLMPTPACAQDPFPLSYYNPWTSGDGDSTYSVAWGDVAVAGTLGRISGDTLANPYAAPAQTAPAAIQYCTPPLCLDWSSTENDYTASVAWGDYDGDGDLDLAVGNWWQPNRLYRNDGGALTLAWTAPIMDSTRSMAWGDSDGDGDLDLAVGNEDHPNRLYRNDGGVLALAWSSVETDYTWSVAWGDSDGDGDLDLAVGNEDHPNRLYRNDGGALTLAWTAPITDSTRSMAWGDSDGDGDLDLAVGNYGQPNRLYRNDGGALTLAWSSIEIDYTTSVAWGDSDGDGDLDLAVGDSGRPNRLYRNDDGALTLAWSSVERDYTWSVAWGDYDGDGDLDLAVGNGIHPNRLYRNDDGALTLAWSSTETDDTLGVAWGDYDGDGDLDLAVGNLPQPNRLYRNEGGALALAWSSAETDHTTSVAWGDYDGDGELDLAVGNWWQPNRLYRNDGGALALAWSSAETDHTTSVAWGDYDGDGELDLAVGNSSQPNRLYRNDGGALTLAWSSIETDYTSSVAWGDYDGDGDLDLAVGNGIHPDRLYRNDGGALTLAWSSTEIDDTTSVAWGDYDGDGDLDLAVGNGSQPNRLYRNEGGALTLAWSSVETDWTYSVAWGDYDGDGDLDLAVGNTSHPNRLYRNDGGALALAWSSIETDLTTSVVWGDSDGDGDLDLAVGNSSQPNRLYRNDGGALTLAWSSVETDETGSVAWGDSDGDGDLDLAVGNGGDPNRLYRNGRDGRALPGSVPVVHVARPGPNADFFSAPQTWLGPIVPLTYTLSDAQGDPVKSIRAWYSPDGGGKWYTAPAASGTVTTHLATTATYVYNWDIFGSGFFGQSDNVVFRIQAVPAIITDTRNAIPGPYLYGAYASQTFPFRVRGTQIRVYSETVAPGHEAVGALVYRLPAGQTTSGALIADSSGRPFHTDVHGYLQGRGELHVDDQLLALVPVHTELNYGGALEFDGVDDYVIRDLLDNAPITETTVSFWMRSEDTTGNGTPFSYASPLTDDTFLITDYNDFTIHRGDGISVTTGVTATDGAWHHIAVTWRSAGGQVWLYKDGVAVYSGTLAAGTVILQGGSLMLGKDQNGTGFFQGYLDEVRIWNVARSPAEIQADTFRRLRGNEPGLVVYWPFDDPSDTIAFDQTANGNDGAIEGATWLGDYLGGYTVYHTNGEPIEGGLDAFTVAEPGVQVLTVTAEHPLILFDIDVSLEWDAHSDPVYLQQLEIDLKQASKHLYDFTDGQVALGEVTVHQNADNWAFSHVAVQASNRLRPYAAIGGVVSEVVTDTQYPDVDLTYGPGQVRMGATWNRYGTPGQNIGVDWPLILAHELSHYFLYLFDVYLGVDEGGLLIPWDDCTGSAMGDVYVLDNTEFVVNHTHWISNCQATLAHQTLGRTEWETIQSWYEWLIAPAEENPGPYDMPFDFTTVTILSPTNPMDTLEDPMFYLDYAGQGEVSSSGARAFLLRDGDGDPTDYEYVYDLGSPTGGQNRLLARGAQPGDRLCVFDRPRHQYGCEVIERHDERLEMERDESWTPVIQLSPVNSTTFGIQVGGLTTGILDMRARLYPEYGSAFTETKLYSTTNGAYSGTLDLVYPAMIGHVQVWISETVAEEDPRREAIVGYTMGGNPGLSRGGGGGLSRGGGGGLSRGGGGGLSRGGGGGSLRTGEAPLVSPDGQMILFHTYEITFAQGQFYTIQTMPGLPTLPPGRTLVGQGYNLVATGFPTGTGVLTGSISFQYMGIDMLVAGVDESDLSIYFWDGDDWDALDTAVDTTYNMASAPSQGPGVYALMASVTIPLYGPGWNLVSYPVRGTRTVTEALRSISGTYGIVYGYVVTDTSDPWRVYGVGAPAWVNRLHELRFGQGYWISVTEPVTWYLGGGSGGASGALAAGDGQSLQSVQNMESPPATYYGPVLAGQGFTPTAGMAMSAWISGKLCGQGRTLEVGGDIVYSVHVFADGPGGAAGCGAPGRYVTFQVDSQAYAPGAAWDNRRLWELALRPAWHVYLPLVLRRG